MVEYDPNTDPLKKKITYEDFVKAIEKNGLPKHIGDFFVLDGDGIVSACAFGQAAINLNVEANYLFDQFSTCSFEDNHINKDDVPYHCEYYPSHLSDLVVHLNDTHNFSLQEIAELIKDLLPKDSVRFIDKKGYKVSRLHKPVL